MGGEELDVKVNPFLRVIDSLNQYQVRYVIVGGFAAYIHGTRRVTVDLDLVVDLRQAEAKKAIEALLSIGLQSQLPVDPMQFADEAIRKRWAAEKNMLVFSMFDPGQTGFVVDLFLESPGDFEALYGRSVELKIDQQKARICSVDDLISMKLTAGRPQDLLDVETLRRLKSTGNPSDEP